VYHHVCVPTPFPFQLLNMTDFHETWYERCTYFSRENLTNVMRYTLEIGSVPRVLRGVFSYGHVRLRIVFFCTNCACTQQVVPADDATNLYCGRWVVLMSTGALCFLIFVLVSYYAFRALFLQSVMFTNEWICAFVGDCTWFIVAFFRPLP
jgi:hypothetical protein